MAIFHACDIRGIADSELTDELVDKIAAAVGVKLNGKKVVVGGDIRLSTPQYREILINRLARSGCQVINIGTVATPIFYYALKKVDAAGGVMVTASHNPPKYNGFKLVLGPQPVTEADIQAIRRLVELEEFCSGNGSITALDVIDDYLEFTQSKARPNDLKIVVDAGNGAASLIAPRLYRRLGYQVTELFCQPDGTFPNRAPNPALAENLVRLGEAVLENGAQLGVAFDGDGDRVGFVDEQGNPVDNDDILVLIARYYLERQGCCPIIYDAKCSMVVAEEIAKAGGRPVMARAGHTFSKAAFLREKAAFAGEISGHFFCSELGYDDGMYAGLKVAEFVAEHGRLSELVGSIPNYILTPDIRVPYEGADKEEILAGVAQTLAKYNPNTIDGVRIEFADGWAMIRASVTEPLFTLRFEAKTSGRLKEIGGTLLDALPQDVKGRVRVKLPPEML